MYTYRIMSVSVDGACYLDTEFTTLPEAIEFANVKQYNADVTYDEYAQAYNSLGYRYIVQRCYHNFYRSDVVYESRSKRRETV